MTPSSWLIIIVLIAVNALYVAAEFAAVSVRRSRLQQLADEGNLFARRLVPMLRDTASLDRYVAACQIGITLSSLVLGAYGQAVFADALAPVFVSWGGLQHAAAQSASAVVVLIGLTVLQVVLGELVPKSLALQYSTQAALYTVMPMRWSLALFSWFTALLNGSGIALLKFLRVPYGGHRHIHSPEEIDLLLAESRDGGLLEEDEHHRLHEALQLTTRTAGELMVPRRYVTAVDIATPIDEVLLQVSEGPFTRVPVYRDSLDNVVGILHARDLMLRAFEPGGLQSLLPVMRRAVYVPENVTADRLLAILRNERSHLAVVIDEYGGVEGLVTLEDVLSELLGEVGDEFKADQSEPERLPDGRVRLPGLLHLEEVGQWTGVPWEGEATTVGGYLFEVMGRIPAPGDRTSIEGVLVEVEQMDNHAVVSVLVTPRLPSESEGEA